MFQTSHLTRQLDIIPLSILGEPITVVGAGAVGSMTVLGLAKMGFSNIQVFDFDKVSIENMNVQVFPYSTIGQPKVLALKQVVKDFANVEIQARNEFYGGNLTFKGIVIAAVDSMQVRQDIWNAHKGKAYATRMIIDPRMGAEVALLYTANPTNEKDIKRYEKSLYSDVNAVQERCTAKATIYTAFSLGALVCKCVKEILTDGKHNNIIHWSIKDDEFQAWGKKPFAPPQSIAAPA